MNKNRVKNPYKKKDRTQPSLQYFLIQHYIKLTTTTQ
jgi:hypothetical protein